MSKNKVSKRDRREVDGDERKMPLAVRLLVRPLLRFGGMVTRGSSRMKSRAFGKYRPTEHDVFVCSYPKSGTNWTLQITYQIAHLGEGTFEHVHDVIPWVVPLPGGRFLKAVRLDDPTPWRESPTGLRVIKTHFESDFVPYSEAAKYVVVARDPKDVFVSSYFFGKNLLQATLDPPEFAVTVDRVLDHFLSGDFILGSWSDHVASFWPWRERENVLFLTFNEMKADLPGIVDRVADLMEVDLTEEQKAKVVEKSGFDHMKGIDHKFAPPFVRRRSGDESMIMRKGKVGGSSELLSPEQRRRIDDHFRAEFERRGCDFPYAERFEVEEAARPGDR